MKISERRAERRGFLIGTLFAAWHLHRGHGEDTYAEELLTQAAPISTFKRLAHAEDYQFQRGFWASCERRIRRSRAA